ncbi:MAG: Ribose-5-phosphate isomerase A [Methanoregulaceae archaeon PtaB.Bin108]|nr:MAG: Ribose-5-phosphate isomerase A [Methanoregulaceae archaeon PtaB.Bin108]OPY38169.1 MAG: Ribose-5-phosphate isomerase A [Methanoregulaceae archaeon PtaU1.Bin059]
MISAPAEKAKKDAGFHAANLVKDGMILGLGTGSTTYHAMVRLSARRKEEHLSIAGVPTSLQTAIRARDLGIPLTTLDDHPTIDMAIDGADQVDPILRLIKGRGAALTREKVVAEAAGRLVIVVDEGKLVTNLTGVVPVEVIPFAITPVMKRITGMGADPLIREGNAKDGPVITDNGNYILDCSFSGIVNPGELEDTITAIPGVVECGLFCNYTGKTTVIIGGEKGCRVVDGRKNQEI